LAEEDALELLSRGAMELEGRLVDASNTTLRAEITLDGLTRRCVYKPVTGERPLWDFPDGTLAGREVSAYLVSHATGWDLVPPTILRDGPMGTGACQLWIDEPAQAESLIGFVPAYDIPEGWLAVANARDEDGDAYALAHKDDPRLARLAVTDPVVLVDPGRRDVRMRLGAVRAVVQRKVHSVTAAVVHQIVVAAVEDVAVAGVPGLVRSVGPLARGQLGVGGVVVGVTRRGRPGRSGPLLRHGRGVVGGALLVGAGLFGVVGEETHVRAPQLLVASGREPATSVS